MDCDCDNVIKHAASRVHSRVHQVLSVEHADVLDEIEQLRGQLKGLESAVVTGQQSPSAIKVSQGGARRHADDARPVL